MNLLCALIILFLCLYGCSSWVSVGGKYVSPEHQFETELPVNWRRLESTRDGLLLTRDGLPLQTVRITRIPADKDLPFTKRKFTKGMLNQEVAEIAIDDLRSNQNLWNFQILQNVPVELSGHPGFKVVYSYQTKDNLKKSGIYYGAMIDRWYYSLCFEAPSRHYFSRDQATFEQLLKTFKITL